MFIEPNIGKTEDWLPQINSRDNSQDASRMRDSRNITPVQSGYSKSFNYHKFPSMENSTPSIESKRRKFKISQILNRSRNFSSTQKPPLIYLSKQDTLDKQSNSSFNYVIQISETFNLPERANSEQ